MDLRLPFDFQEDTDEHIGYGGRRHTKGRKEDAPKVLPLGLSDHHAQRQILAGGKAKGFVVAGGVLLGGKRDADAVLTPLQAQGLLCGGGQLRDDVGQTPGGLVAIGTPLQRLGRAGEHGVAHLHFERLILVAVGIGQHVQANNGVVDVFLTVNGKIHRPKAEE